MTLYMFRFLIPASPAASVKTLESEVGVFQYSVGSSAKFFTRFCLISVSTMTSTAHLAPAHSRSSHEEAMPLSCLRLPQSAAYIERSVCDSVLSLVSPQATFFQMSL